MQVGIIGLPNVGKSTIFNALTHSEAQVADYPFCTIEPNLGVIEVPDENLQELRKIHGSKKISPATIKVLDVAGLVKGASDGEGLGNKFLSNIRTVDALVMILRCFDDVEASENRLDVLDDIGILKTELMLSDLEVAERKREKLKTAAKSGDTKMRSELETIEAIIDRLDSGRSLGIEVFDEKSKSLIREMDLLSFKPIIYVANVGEGDYSVKAFKILKERFGKEKVIKINAELELEILELPESERQDYRKELGIDTFSTDVFIKACYGLLDLITFYTINENETRAWSLEKGTDVCRASGKIHTDMQEGFIKAEVINYNDLSEAGSMQKAKETGKVRIEGRDYIVKDKDIIQIRFSK